MSVNNTSSALTCTPDLIDHLVNCIANEVTNRFNAGTMHAAGNSTSPLPSQDAMNVAMEVANQSSSAQPTPVVVDSLVFQLPSSLLQVL